LDNNKKHIKHKRRGNIMSLNMSHFINKKEEAFFKSYVRGVPDFPKKGILFRDITPLLSDQAIFKKIVQKMCQPVDAKLVDKVAGIESRGFILGGAMALHWNVGFIPIRKAGKLPCATYKESYGLEYGKAIIEIHKDAFALRQNIILVDDVLATGGTAQAACKLVEKCGAKVMACMFLIELKGLKGIQKLSKYNVFSLLKY
jgi:adenine phosphoribosyltransferase